VFPLSPILVLAMMYEVLFFWFFFFWFSVCTCGWKCTAHCRHRNPWLLSPWCPSVSPSLSPPGKMCPFWRASVGINSGVHVDSIPYSLYCERDFSWTNDPTSWPATMPDDTKYWGNVGDPASLGNVDGPHCSSPLLGVEHDEVGLFRILREISQWHGNVLGSSLILYWSGL